LHDVLRGCYLEAYNSLRGINVVWVGEKSTDGVSHPKTSRKAGVKGTNPALALDKQKGF
jgi:hypothetical protein